MNSKSNKFALSSLQFAKSNIHTFFLSLISIYLILATNYSFSQTEYEPPKLTCVRNITTAPAGTELNWNLPLTPNPCFIAYEIYASTGNINGPYSLITTVTNPAQSTIQITPPSIPLSTGTAATVSYFYMINRGSCVNPLPPAKKTSDTLSNEKPQPYTVIKNATVVNGHVILNWYPAQSSEVLSYLIYNNQDGFTTPDTVYGRLNTTFTDTTSDPDQFSIRYKIRSLEYCEDPAGQQGAITPDSADHSTILMQIAPPDKCTQTTNISWLAYKIGTAQVVNYEVQKSINGGPFSVEAIVPSSTTNYLLQNIPFKDTVCIRINANLPNGAASLSNERCFSANVIQKPHNDYIRNVSVVDGNIIVEYKIDTAAAPPKTIIPQRSNDGIIFAPNVPPPTFPDAYTYLFTDPLDAGAHPYSYRIDLVDSCFDTHSSDTATSLYIGIKVKSNNTANLIWSGFEIQNSTFDHFELIKTSGGDTTTLGAFSRSQTSYTDIKLFDYSQDSLDNVCYFVKAFFINNNDATPRQTLESNSNIVCVQPEPVAFVPQAFAPNGHNKTFKPFLRYAISDNYDFKIFDRWYQLLFSTNNVNDSWDGTYKGSPSQLDAYIYIIKFTGKNGQQYSQTGTVMLIR
ncbi:MAG: hypothetical protein JWN78_1169 [Bacteroidota bacterium]|nr:hypothetical protein [Bacteroidota bacterium]